ncbi:MAG: glucokinase [Flavisolibacter sp.]
MLVNIAKGKQEMAPGLLAADIGATKTNIAVCVWEGRGFTLTREASFKTKNFTGVLPLVETFMEGETLPSLVCLAVAGPVRDHRASMTNIHWEIDSQALSETLGRPVHLLNDLEATAYGLALLEEGDRHLVHAGEPAPGGNLAIIAPGTGLGEAGLYAGADGFHPFATEGGHASFAPRTEMDAALYHFARKSFAHVSWERIISGPGIALIYDFLVQVKEREEPPWIREKILAHDKASVISEHAGECRVCGETMELFVRYLAEASATLVLTVKATGGLYVAGGILPQILPLLHEHYFLKYFSDFGRLRPLLQAVPVHILLNKKAPLLGAAYYGGTGAGLRKGC